MLVAVSTALASAACFAAGSALQQRIAGSVPESGSGAHLIGRLVRRPGWLVGLLLSAVAFALHAVALAHGDLAVVQPVIVSGIVFAVLFRAALDRRLPRRRTLVWLLLTWAGLALFLAVRPEASDAAPARTAAVIMVAAGLVVAAGIMLAARRVEADRRRGLLRGATAGLLFGLVAGLTKVVTGQIGSGWGAVFGHWSLWALLAIGTWAIVMNQRAYQTTRLSITAPMLNIAQVLVAITFGVAVFGEDLGGSVPVIAGQLLGLVAIAVGIRQLSTD